MAINGSESKFTPVNDYTVDTFKEVVELSSGDIAKVQEWKQLKANGDTTSDRFVELTQQLNNKIITAYDWNLLLDAMYNLQQAYKDKGLTQIESTVEDYVENYAKQDINNKLGTQINELLLTEATRIIISTSQPTVENGALWIKPKTT